MRLSKSNIILMVLIFIAFSGLGLYLVDLWDIATNEKQAVEMKLASKDCNVILEPCSASVDGKVIRLVLHGPVRYLQHFDYSIEMHGFDLNVIEKISVQFDMIDMHMGMNRYLPRPSEDGLTWTGVAVLPVCVTGRKDWQVTVLFESTEENYRARFNFSIQG